MVPLGVGDFLDRATLVYGDREAVVDEPGVAGSWGRISYRELQRRFAAENHDAAAHPDRLVNLLGFTHRRNDAGRDPDAQMGWHVLPRHEGLGAASGIPKEPFGWTETKPFHLSIGDTNP